MTLTTTEPNNKTTRPTSIKMLGIVTTTLYVAATGWRPHRQHLARTAEGAFGENDRTARYRQFPGILTPRLNATT